MRMEISKKDSMRRRREMDDKMGYLWEEGK
jgi:hypothetical protein